MNRGLVTERKFSLLVSLFKSGSVINLFERDLDVSIVEQGGVGRAQYGVWADVGLDKYSPFLLRVRVLSWGIQIWTIGSSSVAR